MNTQTQEALKELQEARDHFSEIYGIAGEYIYVSGQQNMNNILCMRMITLNKAIDKLVGCINE